MSEKFNAADPFDATAERLRTMMCSAAIDVIATPEYRSLPISRQLEAVICGLTTGLMSVAFACVAPEGHDDVTAFIKSYIDQARQLVEGIQAGTDPASSGGDQ